MVLLLCAAPRLAALVVFWPPSETQYSALARGLADAHRYMLDGAPTARIEPLAPAMFAAGRTLLGQGDWAMLLFPLALGCAAGVALFSLTRHATASSRAAWTATLLYAFSPYLIRQSATFMEVTLATALLILTAWRMRDVGTPARTIVAGLLCGAIVLVRFSFLPIAALGVWLIGRRAGTRSAALAAAVAAVCLTPWIVHSRATDGSFWPSRIGENLYVSTSEWARDFVPWTNVDVFVPLATESVENEKNGDRVLFGRAIDYARRHPARVAMLKLRNLAYALQPRLLPFTERVGSASIVGGALVVPEQRPRPRAEEWIAAAFQSVLLTGGAFGLWKRRGRLEDDAFLLIVFGSVLAVNVIFFPTSRLLAPATFVLMFYVSVNFAD